MSTELNKNGWHVLSRISPSIVDVVLIFFYGSATSWLTKLFETKSDTHLWIIIGLFTLLCVGIFFLNTLQSETPKNLSKFFTYPALTFGAIIMMMAFQGSDLLERESALIPTILAILVIAYFVLVATHQEQTTKIGTAKYFFVQLFCLGIIGVMILLSGAFYEFSFFNTEDASFTSVREKIFLGVIMYSIFLLAFASPRLLFLAKNFTKYGLASALISIAYYVWHSMTHIAF